ncbi:MAG: hypothetical protein LAQ69_41385 [Acidobacteriia bacterium]|nr:hypothetical protein [Terriglobia bacterium]
MEHLHSENAAHERQIEEKLDRVVEDIEDIEELIHGSDHEHQNRDQKTYCVEIEGGDYPWHEETITVAEIRKLGNLPPDKPVIEVNPDNQERTLAENEIIHLKPGHRYGKKVRYKRGLEDRMSEELKWLQRFYPQAEWHPVGTAGWMRISGYNFPAPIWNRESDTVCFEVPIGFPGQAPYSFYVTTGLRLRSSGSMPQNYQEGVTTPFPGSWGRLSWTHDGTWRPTAELSSGSNLTNFVLTFADRLRETS